MDERYNPLWNRADQQHDPLARARQVARVLLGLLDDEAATMMRDSAIRHGEVWLIDGSDLTPQDQM